VIETKSAHVYTEREELTTQKEVVNVRYSGVLRHKFSKVPCIV
jgi:hypothetical protein